MKKQYTKKQIEESIAYWKNILLEADDDKTPSSDDKHEADSTDQPKADEADKKAADSIIDIKETAETPIGEFNIWTRMYRLHNGAVSRVRKNLGQFLQKQKAGSPETVVVTNSCVKENTFEAPKDGKMYVTITVKLDKAQLTGFRKMVALMKESRFYDSYNQEMLNEGFFSDFVAGLKQSAKALGKVAKDTATAMGKTAEQKLKTAHERLKKNIGVEAMRTYVTAFCGKKLGDKVSLKNIAMNEDEEGTESAEITFKSLITIPV